jgi:hypothetical protein
LDAKHSRARARARSLIAFVVHSSRASFLLFPRQDLSLNTRIRKMEQLLEQAV